MMHIESTGDGGAVSMSRPTPCSADLRVAARVLRWAVGEADEEWDDLPWWRKLLEDEISVTIRHLVVYLDTQADKPNAEHHARHEAKRKDVE
jgi:hypothetical protein